MIETILSWPMPIVRWLSQWLPDFVATLIVYGALSLAIGIPLSEAWAFLRRRWWRHVGRTERRLIWLSMGLGAVLCARGLHTGYNPLVHWGLLSLAATVGVVAYTLRPRAVQTSPFVWETRTETAPDFPVVTWIQELDTGLLQQDQRHGLELNMMLVVIVGGTVVGWILGGWEGAAIGLFIACYFAPGADRDATPPRLENVGGHVPMPGSWGKRQPTELERRIDAEPITEFWQAQAFIEPVGGADMIEGEPTLVVHWRNPATGEIRLIRHQSWKDLWPFERESYQQIYGHGATPLRYQDPWVIITRTDQTGLALIARDMRGQAALQETFFKLVKSFGPERRAKFLREREVERRRRGLDRPLAPPEPERPSGARKRPPL